MAFADERTVMNEIERLVFHIWETMGIQAKMKKPMKKAPFMHMTYMEAMACYGSDKPDLEAPGACQNFQAEACQLQGKGRGNAQSCNVHEANGEVDLLKILATACRQIAGAHQSSILHLRRLAVYLEFKVLLRRKIQVQCPDIAIIPAHCRGIVWIPAAQAWVTSHKFVTLAKGDLEGQNL